MQINSQQMKILLITSEEWNDYVYCNGVLTNWFTDFPAEFAQIYVSPGLPNNHICMKYFQITDAQMVRSILGGPKAGKEIRMQTDVKQLEATKSNARRKGVYGFMKKLTLWCRTPVVVLQDAIWALGKYDRNAMEKFVKDFNPDVVYCPRKITPKLIRLEQLVSTMTGAPFVAFTADDEASYQQYEWSPTGYADGVCIGNLRTTFRVFINIIGLSRRSKRQTILVCMVCRHLLFINVETSRRYFLLARFIVLSG